MRALPLIFGGSAAAMALYGWRRRAAVPPGHNGAEPSSPPGASAAPEAPAARGHQSNPDASADLTGRWVWPVGVWHGRRPEITDGYYGGRRSSTGQRILHGGVDLMYPRQPADTWKAGTPDGSTNYVMPSYRAALAASDGVVWSARNTPRGWTVILDHSPRRFSTYYTHLSSLLVVAKQRLGAGAPIGVIGVDPLDDEHVRHLHFELWRGGSADRFDPAAAMAAWSYVADPGDVGPAVVAANAGHPAASSAPT